MDLKKVLTGAALAASLGLGGAWSLIDKWEPARDMTKTYVDPLGHKTVCRGNTASALTSRTRVTQAECDAADVKAMQNAEATVRRCITAPMTPGELNAWTSFAYNVGPGGKGVKDGMCRLKSGNVPSHVRLANAGRPRAACAMLMQWTMPGTVVHNGLYARRLEELAMCLHDLPEGSP